MDGKGGKISVTSVKNMGSILRRIVSGSWFEHLSKFIESLLYVDRFKLLGLQ